MLCLISFRASAQDGENAKRSEIDSLYAELELLFSEDEDLLEILGLADSLMSLDHQRYNAFCIRSGYVSKIVTAGRDFGIDQHGFTSGTTFFHHTDLYAGVAGYWNSAYDPQYFLTNLSMGYLHTFWKKLNTTLAHEFYFYNDTVDSQPFNKAASASAYYQHGWFDVGGDFNLYYGNEVGYRLSVGSNLHLTFKDWWFLDRVSITPGAMVQWGNNTVFFTRQLDTPLRDIYEIIEAGDYPTLERADYRRLGYLLSQNRTLATYRFLRNRSFTDENIDQLIAEYQYAQIQSEEVFGLMNYAFYIPVTFTLGKWSLMCNYTYNIPVTLPGETYEYPASNYFSLSLSYMMLLK